MHCEMFLLLASIVSVFLDLIVYLFFKLMCLIGESFGEDNDTVNGAVVNIRNKGDKIGLWTQKADEQDSIMRIG